MYPGANKIGYCDFYLYNVAHWNIFVMDHNNIIECGGFYFIHNFDSGNLGHVERVPTELIGKHILLIFDAKSQSPKTCNNFGSSCQIFALFTDFLLLSSAWNRFEGISMHFQVP